MRAAADAGCQALRHGHRRRRPRPDDRARRDRRLPRPQRRRQDHDHRHAARACPAPTRGTRRGLRHGPADRRRPRAGSPPSCRPAGCSRTSPSRETVELTAALFAAHPPGRRGARAGRHRRHRRPPGRQVLRRPAAAAALRAWRCCPTPTLLVLDEPTTGMDVEGRRDFWTAIRADAARGRTVALRHALPRRGRRLRRPDRPGQPRPDRRRRHRRRDQGLAVRPARSAPPCRTPTEAALLGAARRRGRRAARRHRAAARRRLRRHRPPPADPTAARDLEITSRSLEDAFLALTGDDRCTAAEPPDDRPPPARRGASRRWAASRSTFLRLEIRRLLRNRRTLIFTLIMPPLFFLHLRHRARPTAERRPRQRHGLPHDQPGRVRRDARHHQRRRDRSPSSGRRAGAGSCG